MIDVFPAHTPTSDLTRGRVLVVDDDPLVRRFAYYALTASGYAVDVASSTEEALPMLPIGKYDVALIDLELPGQNGLVLLENISTEKDLVPVLLTGTRDVRSAVNAMKLGAFDYLTKPADTDEIRWVVARAVNVAQTRRRERLLARVAAEWEGTFDACPDLLLVVDTDGRILRANHSAERYAGSPAVGLRGRDISEVFTGEFGSALKRCLEVDACSAVPMRVSDGATFKHFLVSGHPIPNGTAPTVVVARDITTIHLAEQMKTKLARQLLTAQEDERGRISRELHDGVGQSLASLAMGLNMVLEQPIPTELHERLITLWRVASEAVEEIRRLAHRFRPPILDDLGLVAALGRLTEVFNRIHPIRAELIVPIAPEQRLPQPVELAIYRIVQEALANVAKHAGALTVDVLLEVDAEKLHVSITDDGTGFSPTAESQHRLGLSDMRERADMLGGVLHVDSAPGRGTTVDVRIPLREIAT